jgi:hypothetical protein
MTTAQYYSLFSFSSAYSSIKMAAAVIKFMKRGSLAPALFFFYQPARSFANAQDDK